MAISKKKENGNSKKHDMQEFVNAKVGRVHDFGNGTISFNCTFDDLITVYGMKYIEGKKKDGTEYSFFSFPKHRGNDGNYYNHCYCFITESLHDQIIEQLEKALNE